MIKKLSTIYFSPTGTTAKVTKEIAMALGCQTKDYDLTFAQNRNKYRELTFDGNDLVIVAVPVYSGRIPVFLEDYLAKFEGHNTPTIFTVVYGNRDYDDALLELKNIFEKRGFKGIAASAFIGEHSYTEKVATDRPDATDLNLAYKFGLNIKSKLNLLAELMNNPLIVKGNFPYKERIAMGPIAFQTNENCTDCGICAETCPMEAIDITNFRVVDAEKCICCCSCIKKCPENAKTFTNETILKMSQILIRNYSSIRKEPELFF